MLRDQLLVRSLDAYSAYLPQKFDQENFAFYGTVLNGRRSRKSAGSAAVNFTVGALGDDVSKLYVAKYFPPETKAAADPLVKNVIGAMDRRIDTARLDERRKPRPRRMPSWRRSRPRSAIHRNGAT